MKNVQTKTTILNQITKHTVSNQYDEKKIITLTSKHNSSLQNKRNNPKTN